ncbi:hypothetical protein HGRIS_005763 [Hohenbuehelia grisea]|uniref:Uncharacterized protein n=1 Tax=Hohenbuehelia grisea TaxID=104357 RepID=A0ABR3JXS5_9AGAR
MLAPSIAYETSLVLAIIFESPRQVTAIVPHLVPGLYLACPAAIAQRLPIILLSLLHYMIAEYPSQRSFRRHIDTLPTKLLPIDADSRQWVLHVAACLRTRNYTKFERLTRPAAYREYCGSSADAPGDDGSIQGPSAERAFYVLVDALRVKARGAAWMVIRSAYRELSCPADYDWTRAWLIRSLALESVVPGAREASLDEWLEAESKLDHVRRKEGVEGRWVVCKAR